MFQSRDELGAAGFAENTLCDNSCGYHSNTLWSAQEDALRRVIFVEVQCEFFLKDLSGNEWLPLGDTTSYNKRPELGSCPSLGTPGLQEAGPLFRYKQGPDKHRTCAVYLFPFPSFSLWDSVQDPVNQIVYACFLVI